MKVVRLGEREALHKPVRGFFYALYAGNLAASQSVNSGYKKMIGTGTEISELWPDAAANLNSSSNNVVIAEGSKVESHGGTLIASSGSLLGW